MRIIISFLIGFSLYAQAPSTIAMSAPPPSAPTNISVQVVGGSNSTYYYWIVAVYPIGKVITPSPVIANRAPNVFSSTNYVNVGWGAQTGAISYDVLRTTSNVMPNGTTNSRVALGLTITSFRDTIVSPSSYTLGPMAVTFKGQMSIDNTNSSVPVLLWTLPQVDNFPVNVITFSDGTTQNTAGGGGGGGISGPGSATVNAITLWTNIGGTAVKNSPVTIDPATGILTNTVSGQPFSITGPVTTAPSTPVAGNFIAYSDSTQKGWSVKDDAGQITRTIASYIGASDPGCTTSVDIGRQWTDTTSSITTHFKICGNVASSPAWVTVF